MQKSCMPPSMRIMHIIDGQPATGSPYRIVLKTIYTVATRAIKQNINPKNTLKVRGTVEKAMIPSTA